MAHTPVTLASSELKRVLLQQFSLITQSRWRVGKNNQPGIEALTIYTTYGLTKLVKGHTHIRRDRVDIIIQA